MNKRFLEKLTELSQEEKEILSTHGKINKSYYSRTADFIVNKDLLIGNKQIEIVRHTRFTDFPMHGHDYLEICYVYNGEITHFIENNKIVTKEGDLLIFNKHIRHSIKKAEQNDIGINFIIADTMLTEIWQGLRANDILYRFIQNNFDKNGKSEYLLFRITDIYPIKNVLDNLIYTLVENAEYDYTIMLQSVSLLFSYLSYYSGALINKIEGLTNDEKLRYRIEKYIDESYEKATLKELAETLGLTQEYVCRVIKANMNTTFKHLLMEHRLIIAENLLLSSNLSISDIVFSIGYENISHFNRLFKEKHGLTPYQWKLNKLKT